MMNSRIIIFTLLTSLSAFCFSQNKKLGSDNVLAKAKLNIKKIEQKVSSSSPEDMELKEDVSEEFLTALKESVQLPEYLGSAINHPEDNGLDYNSYEITVVKEGEAISAIFTVGFTDYQKFKKNLMLDMASQDESGSAVAPFTEKDALLIIEENRVFTDEKTLLVIKTFATELGDDKVLVDDKRDAEDYTGSYGSEEDYREEIRQMKEEGLEVIEDTDEVEEVAYEVEIAEEGPSVSEVEEAVVDDYYVIESTEDDDDDYYEEDRYREIRYLRDYELVDNALLSKKMFAGLDYASIKSLNRYHQSAADVAFWINNEVVVEFGRGTMLSELNMELYDFFETEWIPYANFPMYDDSQSLMEVFLNNGKAIMDVTVYTNKELYEFSKRVSDVEIDDKILSYLPASSPAYSGFSFNYPELATEYERAFKSMITGMPKADTIVLESWELMKLAIDEQALAKIFNGQALTFVDGTNEYTKTYSDYYYDDNYDYVSNDTTITEVRPSYFVILGTDDIETWGRVVRILEQLGLLEKQEGGIYSFKDGTRYSDNGQEIGFYVTLKNGVIAMSNDGDRLLKLSRNNGKVNKVVKAKFENRNSIVQADFIKMKKYLDGNDFDIPSIFSDLMLDYDSFELSGMKFNKDNFSYQMVVKAKDSNTNILQQFVDTFNKVK